MKCKFDIDKFSLDLKEKTQIYQLLISLQNSDFSEKQRKIKSDTLKIACKGCN